MLQNVRNNRLLRVLVCWLIAGAFMINGTVSASDYHCLRAPNAKGRVFSDFGLFSGRTDGGHEQVVSDALVFMGKLDEVLKGTEAEGLSLSDRADKLKVGVKELPDRDTPFLSLEGNSLTISIHQKDINPQNIAVLIARQILNDAVKAKEISEQTASTAEDNIELKLWLDRSKLGPYECNYFTALYKQFRSSAAEKGLVIGENFFPSAILSEEQRRDLLGAVDYADIAGKKEYIDAARNVILKLNPLNGGIGKKVERENYLADIWKSLGRSGESVLGAKSSDLFIEVEINGKKELVSIAEAKLLRLIKEAKERDYAGIVLEELASKDTVPSINMLFNTVYLRDRTDNTGKRKRTYRQLFEEMAEIEIKDPFVEQTFPTINLLSGMFTDEVKLPGGHGLAGFYLALRGMEEDLSMPETVISAVYNEDGINNLPDKYLVGYMAKENVPIVMVTTTKTGLDKKGGQIGIETGEATGINNLNSVKIKKSILESKQAEAANQEKLFIDMGLTEGERGKQFFNTNMVIINNSLLMPLLKDLKEIIGEERFYEVIAPSLIKEITKDSEKTGLGGAIGSVMLNIAGYLETSDDPEIKALFRKYGIKDILRIVNTDVKYRSDFFTPVKDPFDFYLQFFSDFYELNTDTWRLEAQAELPPAVKLDKYYVNVKNVLKAFKGVSVKEARSITINGKVNLQNAVLKGDVVINSEYPEEEVDLNDLGLSDDLRNAQGQIELADIKIEASPAGIALADVKSSELDGGFDRKVGIFGGTGAIGKGFAARLVVPEDEEGGVDVLIGTRNPDKLAKIKDKKGNDLKLPRDIRSKEGLLKWAEKEGIDLDESSVITAREEVELWAKAQGLPLDRISVLTNNDIARNSRFVILGVNWEFALSTIDDVFDDLKDDAVLVCPAVSLDFSQGSQKAGITLPEGYGSAAEMVQEKIDILNKEKGKQVKVVSVLHNIHHAILKDLACPLCNDVVIMGDDKDAKEDVADMVRQMSRLKPVVLGGIEDSYFVELVTALDIRMGQQTIAMANAEAGFGLVDLVFAMKEKGRILTRDEVLDLEREKIDLDKLREKIRQVKTAGAELSPVQNKFLMKWEAFLQEADLIRLVSTSEDADEVYNAVEKLAGFENALVQKVLADLYARHEDERVRSLAGEKFVDSLIKTEVTVDDLNLDMFRDYDYRSTGKEITPAVAFRLGLVWAEMALDKAGKAGITNNRKILLSRDARKIDPLIVEALIAGIRYSGLDVIYTAEEEANAVTSYSWAVQQFKPLMSIFITASHVSRPKDVPVRGFKVAIMDTPGLAVQSLTTKEIKAESKERLISLVNDSESIKKIKGYVEGTYTAENVNENCIRFNRLVAGAAFSGMSLYDLARELEDQTKDPLAVLDEWERKVGDIKPFAGVKIVVDGAHTPSGMLAARTYEGLGAEVILINGDIWEIEGEHSADPSKEKNLVELKDHIKAAGADLGISFDLDGDRGAIVVPHLVKGEVTFDTLAPDNLMSVLMDNFIEEWGYAEENTGKTIAVIRDVLGTAGINDVGEKMGIKVVQTDAGYVFLKKEGRNLRSMGYVIPVYGEKSGHCWLDVSGEIENPLAVSVLYLAMVLKNEKYQDIRKAEGQNPFYEVYVAKVPLYVQAPRFQPYFTPGFLQELALQTEQSIGWRFGDGTPPSTIIAQGKDRGVSALQTEFAEDTVFKNTPAGDLRVQSFNTYKDSDEEGGLYRFADIRFELLPDEEHPYSRFAGRFVFRASSNDPTFVCIYETPVLEGDGEEFVQRKLSAVSGLVLDWLEENDFALITPESIAEKQGISLEEAEKKAADSNLIPVTAHLKDYRDSMRSGTAYAQADGGTDLDFLKILERLLDDTVAKKAPRQLPLSERLLSSEEVNKYTSYVAGTDMFRNMEPVPFDEINDYSIYLGIMTVESTPEILTGKEIKERFADDKSSKIMAFRNLGILHRMLKEKVGLEAVREFADRGPFFSHEGVELTFYQILERLYREHEKYSEEEIINYINFLISQYTFQRVNPVKFAEIDDYSKYVSGVPGEDNPGVLTGKEIRRRFSSIDSFRKMGFRKLSNLAFWRESDNLKSRRMIRDFSIRLDLQNIIVGEDKTVGRPTRVDNFLDHPWLGGSIFGHVYARLLWLSRCDPENEELVRQNAAKALRFFQDKTGYTEDTVKEIIEGMSLDDIAALVVSGPEFLSRELSPEIAVFVYEQVKEQHRQDRDEFDRIVNERLHAYYEVLRENGEQKSATLFVGSVRKAPSLEQQWEDISRQLDIDLEGITAEQLDSGVMTLAIAPELAQDTAGIDMKNVDQKVDAIREIHQKIYQWMVDKYSQDVIDELWGDKIRLYAVGVKPADTYECMMIKTDEGKTWLSHGGLFASAGIKVEGFMDVTGEIARAAKDRNEVLDSYVDFKAYISEKKTGPGDFVSFVIEKVLERKFDPEAVNIIISDYDLQLTSWHTAIEDERVRVLANIEREPILNLADGGEEDYSFVSPVSSAERKELPAGLVAQLKERTLEIQNLYNDLVEKETSDTGYQTIRDLIIDALRERKETALDIAKDPAFQKFPLVIDKSMITTDGIYISRAEAEMDTDAFKIVYTGTDLMGEPSIERLQLSQVATLGDGGSATSDLDNLITELISVMREVKALYVDYLEEPRNKVLIASAQKRIGELTVQIAPLIAKRPVIKDISRINPDDVFIAGKPDGKNNWVVSGSELILAGNINFRNIELRPVGTLADGGEDNDHSLLTLIMENEEPKEAVDALIQLAMQGEVYHWRPSRAIDMEEAIRRLALLYRKYFESNDPDVRKAVADILTASDGTGFFRDQELTVAAEMESLSQRRNALSQIANKKYSDLTGVEKMALDMAGVTRDFTDTKKTYTGPAREKIKWGDLSDQIEVADALSGPQVLDALERSPEDQPEHVYADVASGRQYLEARTLPSMDERVTRYDELRKIIDNPGKADYLISLAIREIPQLWDVDPIGIDIILRRIAYGLNDQLDQEGAVAKGYSKYIKQLAAEKLVSLHEAVLNADSSDMSYAAELSEFNRVLEKVLTADPQDNSGETIDSIKRLSGFSGLAVKFPWVSWWINHALTDRAILQKYNPEVRVAARAAMEQTDGGVPDRYLDEDLAAAGVYSYSELDADMAGELSDGGRNNVKKLVNQIWFLDAKVYDNIHHVSVSFAAFWNKARFSQGMVGIDGSVLLENAGMMSALEYIWEDDHKPEIRPYLVVYANTRKEFDALLKLQVQDKVDDIRIVEPGDLGEVTDNIAGDLGIGHNKIALILGKDNYASVDNGQWEGMPDVNVYFIGKGYLGGKVARINNMPLILARALASIARDKEDVVKAFEDYADSFEDVYDRKDMEKLKDLSKTMMNMPMQRTSNQEIARIFESFAKGANRL